jgi:ParB family chromosome partitioning protein
MTSGTFTSYLVSDITIDREVRQRRELTDIEALAESIAEMGLINPITITRSGTLIAGERRLTAVRSLGWSHISVQFTDELPEDELQLIELHENVRRVDLPWQDHVRALETYHRLKRVANPEQTIEATAKDLGISSSNIISAQQIVRELDAGNEMIAKAETISAARNMVARKAEREKAAFEPAPLASPKTAPVVNADFIQWVKTYEGPKFSFIHCDFPYGINFGATKGMASAHDKKYDDSLDTYRALLDAFAAVPALEQCHLIFWFSMNHYALTYSTLRDQGWTVGHFPLIWGKSDNSGILPDPARGPRRNYETAFFCSKGDRKVVQATSNIFWGARGKTTLHPSEKPEDMLTHFFRMCVDDTTAVLDPTCGGGTALLAARGLKARNVLGLEIDAEYAAVAKKAWLSRGD